jgi:hypothetical protein
MAVFDCHCWLGGSVVPGVAQTPIGVAADFGDHAVERALLLSAHARVVDPLAGNRFVRAAVEQVPALEGCLVAHVNRVDSSVAAMRELMPLRSFLGMAVVGNDLHEPISLPLADEILNAYRRYTKPLLLVALNGASVHAAHQIAKGYPMLKVVLLGMGGRDWRQAVHAAHSATNIVLETSGALDRSKLSAAVEVLGAHRIVFGSGSPATGVAAAMGMVEDAAISDDARRRILWDNAVRLFELE